MTKITQVTHSTRICDLVGCNYSCITTTPEGEEMEMKRWAYVTARTELNERRGDPVLMHHVCPGCRTKIAAMFGRADSSWS